MEQREKVNNVEPKIDRSLSKMWIEAMWMRDQVGEEHELYNDFAELMKNINQVQCRLYTYAEKKEIPLDDNKDAKQQVQTVNHKTMRR